MSKNEDGKRLQLHRYQRESTTYCFAGTYLHMLFPSQVVEIKTPAPAKRTVKELLELIDTLTRRARISYLHLEKERGRKIAESAIKRIKS
ncbi:hypothetical protein OHD50_02320 [Escherichia coli]|nr:hypothetical protein [Escherichia coli]